VSRFSSVVIHSADCVEETKMRPRKAFGLEAPMNELAALDRSAAKGSPFQDPSCNSPVDWMASVGMEVRGVWATLNAIVRVV